MPPNKLSRAMKGNQNAVRQDAHLSFLAIRCAPSDKLAWSQAANKAMSTGRLKHGRRRNSSVLTAWVIATLNRAADKQNSPEETHRRQMAEAQAMLD